MAALATACIEQGTTTFDVTTKVKAWDFRTKNNIVSYGFEILKEDQNKCH